MWDRKQCCICKANFGVHPNAKNYFTRQLCVQCRLALKKKLMLNHILELSDKEI